jgi:hypothetical protein
MLAVFFLNPVACSLDRIYWSNELDLGEPCLNIQYFLWKFTMANFSVWSDNCLQQNL